MWAARWVRGRQGQGGGSGRATGAQRARECLTKKDALDAGCSQQALLYPIHRNPPEEGLDGS